MKTGVVVLVKNEEHILPEWLAFHRALGFERILVLDNQSADATVELVKQAAAHSDGITLEHWSGDMPHAERQRLAYERGLDVMRSEGIEWCLFIDADEFMTCATDETLKEMLRRLDQHAAIALHWSFYGSSGHTTNPPGLTVENYLLRAPASFAPQSLCKSLVRVPYVQGCFNSHLFSLDAKHFPYLDCLGAPVEWNSHGQDHVIAPWRINHYFVQSKSWWKKKIARASAAIGFLRQDHEWYIYDRNEYFDASAAKYGKSVRNELRRMGFEPPPDSMLQLTPQAALASRLLREGIQNGWPEEITRHLVAALGSTS